jgi:hypothetical protein
VSFDVVFLFTRVPIGDFFNLLSQQFNEGDVRLFHQILTSSFCFNSQLQEQTYRVAMGSLLSPVIAKLFMEDYEEVALSKAASSPYVGSLMWMTHS